jgi:hypothetical protein
MTMKRFHLTPFVRSGATSAPAIFAAVAAAAAFAAMPQAQAADLACHPDIQVDNDKPIAIKVLRLEYTVNGKTYTEGLANKTLARNESGTQDEHTWKSQKLQHAAAGLPITATRIEFKEDNSGAGDGFGPPKWSKSFAHSGTCQNSDTYRHAIN